MNPECGGPCEGQTLATTSRHSASHVSGLRAGKRYSYRSRKVMRLLILTLQRKFDTGGGNEGRL